MPIKVKGKIFSGVLRGTPLIKKYYYRIIGILGFEPYKGTMDVKLERPIKIELFATKSIEHLLIDGSKFIEAYFAPVKVKFGDHEIECWAMRQINGIYGDDIVELIGKECFKEKYSLKDGDEVEITFFEKKRFKIPKILKHKKQLMKS